MSRSYEKWLCIHTTLYTYMGQLYMQVFPCRQLKLQEEHILHNEHLTKQSYQMQLPIYFYEESERRSVVKYNTSEV